MTINVKCRCGKRYVLDDKKAGKTVRCKECGAPIVVPGGEEERDEYEVDVLPTKPRIVRARPTAGTQQYQPPKKGSSTVMYTILGVAGGLFLLIVLSCGGCILLVRQSVREMEAMNSFEGAEMDFDEALEEEDRKEREAALRKAGMPLPPADGNPLKPKLVPAEDEEK